MENKCYYTISDNSGEYNIVMTLDGCMEWIKNDNDNYGEYVPEDERPVYYITPIWMTEEEFNNLPEADL